MSLSFDHQSYSPELAREGLSVDSIAHTSSGGSAILADPKLDPISNPDLQQALKIYSKHYLASENGIPGEGEDIDVILSRLRGEDDNVKRMSVVGLKNDSGKVVGVAFIESYEVDKAPEHANDGSGKTNGLVHLVTYAAVEEPYEKTMVNTAFHAGILNEVVKIDKELGYEGNSIIATEVNSELGYNGERQSDKMDPEFEIKTGAPRELRAAYTHGGSEHLLPLEGRHNTSHAIGVRYTPPNLGGEEDVRIPEGASTSDIAQLLRNTHVDDGELLFLTAESAYHTGINAHDAALHKTFQEALNVSVAQGNHGIDDKGVIRNALKDAGNPEYGAMMEDYNAIIAAAAAKGKAERKGAPPTVIITDDAQMQDIEREQRRQTGK